jgi:hypothetical protein
VRSSPGTDLLNQGGGAGLKWVECVVMHKETKGVFSTLVGYPLNKTYSQDMKHLEGQRSVDTGK